MASSEMAERDVVDAEVNGVVLSMEEVMLAPEEGARHVTIWNRIECRKIAGNAAPLRRNLGKYLSRHPECEEYAGQDKLLGAHLQPGAVDEKTGQLIVTMNEHVPIWHTVELRKVTGNAAPLRKNLHIYLKKHPQCEEYCGQDKLLPGGAGAQPIPPSPTSARAQEKKRQSQTAAPYQAQHQSKQQPQQAHEPQELQSQQSARSLAAASVTELEESTHNNHIGKDSDSVASLETAKTSWPSHEHGMSRQYDDQPPRYGHLPPPAHTHHHAGQTMPYANTHDETAYAFVQVGAEQSRSIPIPRRGGMAVDTATGGPMRWSQVPSSSGGGGANGNHPVNFHDEGSNILVVQNGNHLGGSHSLLDGGGPQPMSLGTPYGRSMLTASHPSNDHLAVLLGTGITPMGRSMENASHMSFSPSYFLSDAAGQPHPPPYNLPPAAASVLQHVTHQHFHQQAASRYDSGGDGAHMNSGL
ncbi:hypothetical protein FVE85_6872 [Porphyridium purpureum]|uniref:BRK domain-containing protein n=1 Tax=Porphyridium purpureum TaxID=35688 RepID=A0A5J4Z9G2_PORPP|nr:hypothetical protein FVE85_6872 [Porphyridium purpureum]|eukprot:POR4444..scf295_1